MQRSHALLLALAGALVLLVLARTKRGQALAVDAVEFVTVTAQRISAAVVGWSLPAAGARFRDLFDIATASNGLPPDLLARVAYQESRFRADIIEGRTVSSAGAKGIMQIVPRWHPGVDPLNPAEAIAYAGRYLRRLYDRFGSWELALAAYNWGQGNLSKDIADGVIGDDWPEETRDYVAEISADVGLA